MGCRQASKAPHEPSGGAVIVLVSAGVVAVEVVALEAPGEILEAELVVRTAAYVDDVWVIDEAHRVHMTDAAHALQEGAPLSKVKGEPRAGNADVLRYRIVAASIITTAIDDQSEARKASKGKCLEGGVEAVIALLVDDVGELAVRDAG